MDPQGGEGREEVIFLFFFSILIKEAALVFFMDQSLKIGIAIVISIAAVLLCVIYGFIWGANIGGNYFTEFQAFGRQGYEATGMIGVILGLIIGAAIATLLLRWTLRS
jgi:hypothetical protein